jgi:glutaredoxin
MVPVITVTIYGTAWCGPCKQSKMLCETKDTPYVFINIEEDTDARQMFTNRGFRTVPQIFIGDEHIGGYDDLVAFHSA